MSDVPKPARFLSRGQLVVSIVAVLAVVASVVALVLVLPPALRTADPGRPVRAYLQAVVDGDVPKALAVGRITPAKGDKLLTDAAYRRASGRITAFAVLGTSLDGGTGTVQTRVTQGGTSYGASFAVERAPGPSPFEPWRMAVQQLPAVTAKFDAPVALGVKLAGVELATSNGAVTQHVLPGTYRVDPVGSDLFAATSTTAVASFAQGAVPATMSVSLTDAGSAAASGEVQAWVQQCAASTELAPVGCPFKALPEASVTYTDGKWTVQSEPSVVAGAWSSAAGGWPITTSSPGRVTFSANASEYGLSGTATTGSKPFSVAGTAVPDGSGLRFVPAAAYSAGGGADI